MEIKNLMEGLVIEVIDQLCQEKKGDGSDRYCTSQECRTDAACYVLNRLTPRYAGTSRGIARLTGELASDDQIQVDILRLATEALSRVSTMQREYVESRLNDSHPLGPHFNFPTIRGRLLNGTTFEPVAGISVELFQEDESAAMFDSRWKNPYEISKFTPGTFLFWPAAVPATETGEEKTFSFEIRVTEGTFDPFRHLFRIDIRSEEVEVETFSLQREFLLPDLYLFPR